MGLLFTSLKVNSHTALQQTVYLESFETSARESERKINYFFKGLDEAIYDSKNKEWIMSKWLWGRLA